MGWLQKLHGGGGMGVGGPADWTRFVQETGAGPMAYQQLWNHFQGQPHGVGTLPQLPNMPKVKIPTVKAGAGQANPEQQQQSQQQQGQQQQQPIAGSQVKIDPLAFQKMWKRLRLTPEIPEAQVPQAGIPPQFRPKPRTSADYQVGRRPRSQQHLIQDYYRWMEKLHNQGELPRGGEADWRRFMNERGWGESAFGMLQNHFLGGGITASYSPPEYFTDYPLYKHEPRHRKPPRHIIRKWIEETMSGDWLPTEVEKRQRELTKVGGPTKQKLPEDWMVNNILSHYKLLTPEQTEGGRRWYQDARDWANKIAEETNKDPNRVYATIAALSPQEEWESNIRNAAHMLYNYDPSMGDDPQDFLPTLGDNVRRAIAVHNAEKPEEMFKIFDPTHDPKMRNFYKNFTGNEDAVTIDRWMTRILLGENGNLADKDQGAKELSGKGRYDQMANAIRTAAGHINQGLSPDQQITPAQLQAMLWLRARGPDKEQKSFGPLSVPIADYLLKEPYDESKAEPTYSPPKLKDQLRDQIKDPMELAMSQLGVNPKDKPVKKVVKHYINQELPPKLEEVGYRPWNPEVENRRRKPVYETAPGWNRPSRVPFDPEMLELPQSAFELAASFKRRAAARRCAPLAEQFKLRQAYDFNIVETPEGIGVTIPQKDRGRWKEYKPGVVGPFKTADEANAWANFFTHAAVDDKVKHSEYGSCSPSTLFERNFKEKYDPRHAGPEGDEWLIRQNSRRTANPLPPLPDDLQEHPLFHKWLDEHALFHQWLDEHPQFHQWLDEYHEIGPRVARVAARRRYRQHARFASIFKRRVSGWEWDDHLNGYVTTSANKFSCDCGDEFDTPKYHKCKCGKLWNSYVIGTGGDRKQATAEKFICREIPERSNMLVAHRRTAGNRRRYADWDQGAPGGWQPIEDGGWQHSSGDSLIIPSKDHPGHFQLYDRTVRGQGHWAPIKQPSINPEHLMNYADWTAGRVKRPHHHLVHAFGDGRPHVLSDSEIDEWLREKDKLRRNRLQQQRWFNEYGGHPPRKAAAGHSLTHPAKPSCRTCWENSAERGGSDVDYGDLLKQNHHDELIHEFHKDRYLEQQRHPEHVKNRGTGRYRDRAAKRLYAAEVTPETNPELFPYEQMKPEEEAIYHHHPKPKYVYENKALDAYNADANHPNVDDWISQHRNDFDPNDFYEVLEQEGAGVLEGEMDEYLRYLTRMERERAKAQKVKRGPVHARSIGR